MVDRGSHRAILKGETGSDHDSVDTLFAAFGLETQHGYVEFLTAQRMAWAAVDKAWSRYLVEQLHFADPDYLALIDHDLACLEAAVPAPTSAMFRPACPHGVAYVLAGSRLGIATLRRSACAALEPLDARRFLDERSGPELFRRVIARIETLPDLGLTISSARATFDLFRSAAAAVHGQRLAA